MLTARRLLVLWNKTQLKLQLPYLTSIKPSKPTVKAKITFHLVWACERRRASLATQLGHFQRERKIWIQTECNQVALKTITPICGRTWGIGTFHRVLGPPFSQRILCCYIDMWMPNTLTKNNRCPMLITMFFSKSSLNQTLICTLLPKWDWLLMS